MRNRVRLLVGSLLVIVAGITCYGPTEMVVAVSTDLPCGERSPRIQITTATYDGHDRVFAADANERSCRPGGGRSEMGTLVLVPRGDRDGKASVEVVLAADGRSDVGTCRDGVAIENCIFATRALTFLAHTSRRLPIHLSKECLGVRCQIPHETCIGDRPGGRCVPDDVVCPEDDCGLREEIADGGAPPSIEAGGDSGSEADASGPKVDSSVAACSTPGGKDILATGPMPTSVAASKENLYWVALEGTTNFVVRRMSKKGGASTLVHSVSAGGTGVGIAPVFAVDSDSVVFGSEALAGTGFDIWLESVPTKTYRVNATTLALSAGVGVDNRSVFAATESDLLVFESPADGFIGYRASSPTPATHVAVTAGEIVAYDATSARFTRIDRSTKVANGIADATLASLSLATIGPKVFGGTAFGVGGNIYVLAPTGPTKLLDIDPPTSIAADEPHVYWTSNGAFRRANHDGSNSQVVVKTTVRHALVDPGVGGCIYYWSIGPTGPAELYVMSKLIPIVPDGGKSIEGGI